MKSANGKGTGTRYTEKQRVRALSIIARAPTLSVGLERAGITSTTYYYWRDRTKKTKPKAAVARPVREAMVKAVRIAKVERASRRYSKAYHQWVRAMRAIGCKVT